MGDLHSPGYTINPYDPCVANKTTHCSQMTVTWHVDNPKPLHASPTVLSDFILWIKTIYGTLTASRDRNNTYLGM